MAIGIGIAIANFNEDRDRDRDLNFGDRAHALQKEQKMFPMRIASNWTEIREF